MSSELMYRRSTVIAIWLLLFAGSVYLFLFEPGKTGFFPPCLFRALTGLTCPGCGSTRAMHQILHGHFVAAFMLNPLFLLAIPFLLYALFRYSVVVMRGETPRRNTLPASYIYGLFVIVVSFWVFRNTPFYPFVS
ncbi:MAG TPA: DUF2752 domain-containing protein [Pyrinomonadaceae bacterium]|nr:DUF2752 domain-containing protein [Pyrinomonadaceae bacterium]